MGDFHTRRYSYPSASRHPFQKGKAVAPHTSHHAASLVASYCRQRPATATSPFQKGKAAAHISPSMLQALSLLVADKGPQPRPPPFKRGRLPHHIPPTMLQALSLLIADKDPQPRPPLFKGVGGMQKARHSKNSFFNCLRGLSAFAESLRPSVSRSRCRRAPRHY